jgi:hypothetical protein
VEINVVNILFFIVIILLSLSVYLLALCIKYKGQLEFSNSKAKHYKSVSEYLERINRATRSMNGAEAYDIRSTIPDAVRITVFSGLHESTISLYNILADGGVKPNVKRN